jgi:hypothetical protein
MSSVDLAPIVTTDGTRISGVGRKTLLPESIASSTKAPVPAYHFAEPEKPASQDEVLFDARAALKLMVSQISMHLAGEWRASIFKQIDMLHSLEDWDADSDLILPASFRTFLRFVVFSAPKRTPSLAIAPQGNPVASWVLEDKQVHVEFLPQDKANAVMSKITDRGPEASSWRGPVPNVKAAIEGFGNSGALGW